jgi:hypothetical protein
MLRLSYLLAASSLMILTAACNSSKHSSSKRLPGTWQPTPIVIDGKNNDWPSPYPEYDDKAMLGYMVSNDKDNLYITVETGDPATQLKILRQGLTVWIDRKGTREEVTAINYPIPMRRQAEEDEPDAARPGRQHLQQGQGGQAASNDQRRLEMEDKVRAALDQAKEFSLQGFKSCNLQYPVLEKDSCGVEVRVGLDENNELVWEAVVPFRSFYFKPEIARADKGRQITICFETTGEKRPAGQGGYYNGSRAGGVQPSVGFGPIGMGMGMRAGGYNRGRSQPQQSNIMESLYKSTKTYKKFGLAFP